MEQKPKKPQQKQPPKQVQSESVESQQDFSPDRNSSITAITGMLDAIKLKLKKLKQLFNYNIIADEHVKYMQLKDEFVKNKGRVSLDGELHDKLLGELESLFSRLGELESLDMDEVKEFKRAEKPINLFGKKIELNNYKRVMNYAMYGTIIFISYKFVLKPYVFPMMWKALNTKVKSKSFNSNNVRDAEYKVI